MTKFHNSKKRQGHRRAQPARKSTSRYVTVVGAATIILACVIVWTRTHRGGSNALQPSRRAESTRAELHGGYQPTEKWLQRAYLVSKLYQSVYTPGWEGAYGAIGDAYLFAVTKDSALLRFHTIQHPLTSLYNGYWVDDRAWACLAELYWWDASGRTNMLLVTDASQRYIEARTAGMLSNHEGYWTWYNYPPNARVNEKIFTNSNMNQMVSVACRLYEATGDRRFLDDALRVWAGDGSSPGIEKSLYKGSGRWEGKKGLAAFGKELPWGGTEYCSIGASLYRATKDPKYKRIVVATAKRILDPGTGWVDPVDFYQVHMDGNGAFVHFLMDAYQIAPAELNDIPGKVEKMLEHVWSNHHGTAELILHREFDHGIRNGWNPQGGEDGYGVNEVGTVHAQGEATRAFCIFAYFKNIQDKIRPG
jgi:hypothetical protein